jgi:hypothetical protein
LPVGQSPSVAVCVKLEAELYDQLYARSRQLGKSIPELLRQAVRSAPAKISALDKAQPAVAS